MTWQYFLRTLVIAFLGAAALALASQARAEGGEGSSVISPHQAEAYLSALTAPEEQMESAANQGPADASADASEEERNVEQTAALPSGRVDLKSRIRQSDAVRANALKPLIAHYASENGLPYELADAVIRIESRYNAGARNGPNMGLTQINFRTAQSLGYPGAAAGLLDAETNLRFGLKYLAQAYKLAGGDVCGTILRYQFGLRTQTMTSASRAYCARVNMITAAAE
jgi:soluble lytic murein transglycosylase-like protein